MNFQDLTVKDAIEGFKEERFSPLELTQWYLERIEKLEPKLNAFITVCRESALQEAKQISLKENLFREFPLLGIPIGVKDVYCTKGIKTTAGSRVLENYIPVYDSTVVARLKKAGGIIIGKTNCDAWAHGSSGENSDFGSTKNPWDLIRTPGGSSSGSATALAANECLGALGTDTGGSVRLPASFCNLVGLKPTYGRVSRYGVIAMASSLDCMSVFAKTVYDCALLLRIIAGKDEFDATTSDLAVPNYTEELEGLNGLGGMKIGIPKEYFISGLKKAVEEKVQQAIKILEKAGAEIIEVSLPHTKDALAAYYIIQPSEVSSNLARYDGIRFGHKRGQFGDEAKRRIMLGTYTLSSGYYDAYYLKAMKVRTLIQQDFATAFKKVDLLVAPVSPTLPFKLGEKTKNPLEMYLNDIFTVTVNLAGIPGLVVPVGFSQDLPVGMQIIGPQFAEGKLLQVGRVYEKETEYWKVRPKID